MYRKSLAVVLLSVGWTFAGEVPEVILPKEIKTAPGRLVQIPAKSDGSIIRWASPEDCDLIPFPDGRVAIFSAPKPGKYRVLAWTAKGDVPSEAAICTITVEGVPPVPVPPGPTPPEDPFRVALRRAFAEEKDTANRGGHVRALADFYRRIAPSVANDNNVSSLSDLQSQLRQRNLLASGALPLIRQLLAEELRKELGAVDAPLTPELRQKALRLFERFAQALEGLS